MREKAASYSMQMLVDVAEALGEDLLSEIVFVGGVTTALFISEVGQEDVRSTDDVDLIISVFTRNEYNKMVDRLLERGFSKPKMNDPASDKICSLKLRELEIDLMPLDEEILGFTNIWYEEAFKSCTGYELREGLNIKLINPIYFVATKIEAFFGRGLGSIYDSKDLDDIFTIIIHRDQLIEELLKAKLEVRKYIGQKLEEMMDIYNVKAVLENSIASSYSDAEEVHRKINIIIGLKDS